VLTRQERAKLYKMATKARSDGCLSHYSKERLVQRVVNDVVKMFTRSKDIPLAMFKQITKSTHESLNYHLLGKVLWDGSSVVMVNVYVIVAHAAKEAGIEKLKRPIIKSFLKSLFKG